MSRREESKGAGLFELESVLDVWDSLGGHERRVFLTIGRRLLAGQRKYGKLEHGKKVWTWEAFEEAADMAVYLASGLMDATEETKRRYLASLNENPAPPVNTTDEQVDAYDLSHRTSLQRIADNR